MQNKPLVVLFVIFNNLLFFSLNCNNFLDKYGDGYRDTEAPVAELINTPPNFTNSTGINITVAGSDVVSYRYNLDGTGWSNELVIADPIAESGLMDGSHTLEVIGADFTGNWQSEGSATECGWSIENIDAPVFSTQGGIFDLPQNIKITCNTPNVIIRFTTDGTIPSRTQGNIYENPVEIDSTIILSAIAYCEDCNNSGVTSAFYIIRERDLNSIIRDFTPQTNSDFEYTVNDDRGIINSELGSDNKPVYGNHPSGTLTTHSAYTFSQWYNDLPGTNITIPISIPLSETNAVWSYSNSNFFPIDDQGFGYYLSSGHNFHFTVEIHSHFLFNGNEEFTINGDDDIWVFINKKLVIDLGGVHGTENRSIVLDGTWANNLDLVQGDIYQVDIFTAERHTTQSTFNLSTNAFLVALYN